MRHRRQFEAELRRKGFRVVSEGSERSQAQFVKISAPFKMLARMAEYMRLRKFLKDVLAKPVIRQRGFLERALARPSLLEQGINSDPDVLAAPFKIKHFEV